MQRSSASLTIGAGPDTEQAITTVDTNLNPANARTTQRLVFRIEDIPSPRKDVYIGDRVRQSCATSVVLLDPNTLACCHFNGKRMFLIRFDVPTGTHQVIDSIDTVFAGEKVETDLMSGDGAGRLVTTNFFQNTCTLYQREGDHLRYVRDLGYNAGNRVHGVKFYEPGVIAVTSRQQSGGVHFFDVETQKLRFKLAAPGLAVQDVTFPSRTRAVTISSFGSPSIYPFKIYSSAIHAIDFDMAAASSMRVVRKRIFEMSHFDNAVLSDGIVYLSDQYNNVVLAVHCETLETVKVFDGYDFVHGVDVKFGMIAVTNYGNNTVEIRSLDQATGGVSRS